METLRIKELFTTCLLGLSLAATASTQQDVGNRCAKLCESAEDVNSCIARCVPPTLTASVLSYTTEMANVEGMMLRERVVRMDVVVSDSPQTVYVIESRAFIGGVTIKPGEYSARWGKNHNALVLIGTDSKGKSRDVSLPIIAQHPR